VKVLVTEVDELISGLSAAAVVLVEVGSGKAVLDELTSGLVVVEVEVDDGKREVDELTSVFCCGDKVVDDKNEVEGDGVVTSSIQRFGGMSLATGPLLVDLTMYLH